MKLGVWLLGASLAGVVAGAASARAQCDFVESCTYIPSPRPDGSFRPGDEVRFPAMQDTNSIVFQLYMSVSGVNFGDDEPVHTLTRVDDGDHVFALPQTIDERTYGLARVFEGCPPCGGSLCGALSVTTGQPNPAPRTPPRPLLRSAEEVDVWEDERLCGATQSRFTSFDNRPPRGVIVTIDAPEAAADFRAEVNARIPRPDLGVDQVVYFNTSTLDYAVSSGQGFFVPLGDHNAARAVDLEVRYVNIAGERGPPASIHTTLAEQPPFCLENSCSAPSPSAPSPFGCGDVGPPPPQPGEPVPVEGGLALIVPILLARRLRRGRSQSSSPTCLSQGDCS